MLALGNVLALGVLQAAREERIIVPDDLSLVAFDDQLWAAVTSPALTIVEQPIEALGREVVDLLLERIAAPLDDPPARRILPVRLIERESVRDLGAGRVVPAPPAQRTPDPPAPAHGRAGAR